MPNDTFTKIIQNKAEHLIFFVILENIPGFIPDF